MKTLGYSLLVFVLLLTGVVVYGISPRLYYFIVIVGLVPVAMNVMLKVWFGKGFKELANNCVNKLKTEFKDIFEEDDEDVTIAI